MSETSVAWKKIRRIMTKHGVPTEDQSELEHQVRIIQSQAASHTRKLLGWTPEEFSDLVKQSAEKHGLVPR